MYNEVVSRHVGSSGEILLLIPLKPGFAPVSELVLTYSARLKALLEALYDLRERRTQRGFPEPRGPVERLETLANVQWTVVDRQQSFEDDKQQLSEPQLLVSAHYDRSWEDYFHRLRTDTGALLDLIFLHCRDYDGNTTLDPYERFIKWIRQYQRPTNFLFSALPNVTADDTRYLDGLIRKTRPEQGGECVLRGDTLATFQVPRPYRSSMPDDSLIGDPRERLDGAHRGLFALAEIRDRMFSSELELNGRTGIDLYDAAIRTVIENEPDVRALLKDVDDDLPYQDKVNRITDPKAWANHIISIPSEPLPGDPQGPVPLDQVQANILRACRDRDCKRPEIARAVLVACENKQGWRTLLATMSKSVTTEQPRDLDSSVANKEANDLEPPIITNFALTYAGLERSGIDELVLAQFPVEFRQGLERRTALLGDSHSNDPCSWEHPELRGCPGQRVHVSAVDAMITLHAARAHERQLVARVEQLSKLTGVRVLHVQPLDRGLSEGGDPEKPRRDHFGFADGVSQPRVDLSMQPRSEESTQKTAACDRDRVPVGELLLGHPNRDGRIALCASPEHNSTSHELFANGTFMVVRKLRQDVDAFEAWVNDALIGLGETREAEVKTLYGKVLGRHADGTPLPELEARGPNDFDFTRDLKGLKCPFHSHIRRANPRTPPTTQDDRDRKPEALTPRIMRRGLLYGPHKEVESMERGLFFMAYNASLADQYEVIQRWLNGGNSTDILSSQNDILTAPACDDEVPHWVLWQASSGIPRFAALASRKGKPLVQLRWGLYLFAPSINGIGWLARRLAESRDDDKGKRWAQPAPYVPSIERGEARIAELDALPPNLAPAAWKAVIEESLQVDSKPHHESEDVWAAIRSQGVGLKKTPIGYLVATERAARYVLGDDGSTFSVSAYAERLGQTSGPHYLGRDPRDATAPTYADLARLPNEYFQKFKKTAFADARAHAKNFLAAPRSLQQEPKDSGRDGVSLRDFVRVTIARLCEQWFELKAYNLDEAPDFDITEPGALMRTLDYFLLCSRNAFQQAPESKLTQDAVKAGWLIQHNVYGSAPLQGEMARKLKENKYLSGLLEEDREKHIREAVIGAVVGFAPPTYGSLLRVLDQWVENGQFWFIQQQVRALKDAEHNTALREILFEGLRRSPAPPILYRTTSSEFALNEEVVPTETKFIVGLSSVFADARKLGSASPEAWFFGGEHKTGNGAGSPHGCPAREIGIKVILGAIAALCEQNGLMRERRGVLSYAKKS